MTSLQTLGSYFTVYNHLKLYKNTSTTPFAYHDMASTSEYLTFCPFATRIPADRVDYELWALISLAPIVWLVAYSGAVHARRSDWECHECHNTQHAPSIPTIHTENCTSCLLSWAWYLQQVYLGQHKSTHQPSPNVSHHTISQHLPPHRMHKADQARLEATPPLTQLPAPQHMRHLWHAILTHPTRILPMHMGTPRLSLSHTTPTSAHQAAHHTPHVTQHMHRPALRRRRLVYRTPRGHITSTAGISFCAAGCCWCTGRPPDSWCVVCTAGVRCKAPAYCTRTARWWGMWCCGGECAGEGVVHTRYARRGGGCGVCGAGFAGWRCCTWEKGGVMRALLDVGHTCVYWVSLTHIFLLLSLLH